ncbi:MAG TPA: hypothetical protein VFR75_03230, partial [Solirubrobacterales bacterium]|nr:hypothetical protein [Solirubrobacterales bacterium]
MSIVVAAHAVAFPASATAAPKAVLGSFGTPNGPEGGQLSNSRGLAVNQTGNGAPAGSVYVAEGNTNHRISQFDGDGNFIRAWGYDVVSSGEHNTGAGFEICEPSNSTPEDKCKAGVAGVGAGQLNNPQGIAIDQTNGVLYITSSTNRRVDVFSGSGQFAGAFGWGVDTGAAALEVCTTASECQAAAAAGEVAGNLQSLNASIPSIDPTGSPGSLLVPDVGNGRVAEYSATVTAGVLNAVTFVGAFGWDVDPAGGVELETCTAITGCKKGTSGAGAGQFGPLTNGSPTASAVDSTGAIYVASGPMVTGACSALTPCRVQKFAPGATSAVDFGPTTGPGQLYFNSGASNAVAGLGIAIDPVNDHVFVLFKEAADKYKVHEYDSGGEFIETHPSGSSLPGISNNLGVGIATGPDERVYANMGGAGAGQVFILGPVPPPVPTMDGVSEVGQTSAKFEGTVDVPPPGEPTFFTSYYFEYSTNGSVWNRVPAKDQPLEGGSTGPHPVSIQASGLEPNTAYGVRLLATTGGTPVASDAIWFTTGQASPHIGLTYVEDVTQTEARLSARIDPQGLKTHYWIEWSSQEEWEETGEYSQRTPAFDRSIGGGNEAVIAQELVQGLQAGTAYRFRVVAENGAGESTADSDPFETLNPCGFTGNRCLELVSPPDKGAVGAAGDIVAFAQEMQFQASYEGSSIAYVMAYGLKDATSGNEVVYRADRQPLGWASTQLSAPNLLPAVTGSSSFPSKMKSLSKDLRCGTLASIELLTPDAPRGTRDAGHANLYRLDA